MNTTTERVRDLYEHYPYPPPEQKLGFPMLAALDYVRCVLWPRRASLQGLRVLDAGCGTGHVAVEIASRHPDVEVVGLDLSTASLAMARRRAERAGVTGNLTFQQGALEDLAALGLGERRFDYIVSSGVLHHLADPVAGARALSAHLAPDGAIGLMVYAPHGRRGVYILQELLRRLAGTRSLPEQISVARAILKGLPANHPFRAKDFADQDWGGDAGLVDLLLHVQDRSFTIPELRQMLTDAGLQIARFVLPYVYRPETYLSQTTGPVDLGAGHPTEDRAAIAELLSGTMSMHAALVCHSAFQPDSVAVGDVAARPIRSPLLAWNERQTSKISRGKGRGSDSRITVREMSYTGGSRDLALDGEPALLLERSDGRQTTEEIFLDPTLHGALAGHTAEEKRRRYQDLLTLMLQQDLVYLLG